MTSSIKKYSWCKFAILAMSGNCKMRRVIFFYQLKLISKCWILLKNIKFCMGRCFRFQTCNKVTQRKLCEQSHTLHNSKSLKSYWNFDIPVFLCVVQCTSFPDDKFHPLCQWFINVYGIVFTWQTRITPFFNHAVTLFYKRNTYLSRQWNRMKW